jgi:hypothetical protein
MLVKKNAPAHRNLRTTRVDPPTIEEAIVAAQGLTDHVEHQIEITAQLMGLAEDEVRPVVLSISGQARRPQAPVVPHRRDGAKVIVVERKRPRIASR